MSENKTIFLAIDDRIFAETLEQALTKEGYLVAGTTTEIKELREALQSKRPAILVIDQNLIGVDKPTFLKQKSGDFKIIFLISDVDYAFLSGWVYNGVNGFIHRKDGLMDFIECLQSLEIGSCYVSNQYSGNLSTSTGKIKKNQIELPEFTAREKELLRLLAQEKGNSEIASELNISVHTVKNHRSRICDKLGLKGNGSLARFALKNKVMF